MEDYEVLKVTHTTLSQTLGKIYYYTHTHCTCARENAQALTQFIKRENIAGKLTINMWQF